MDTKKLRQKILDLAIHGKLVPQDPNDEPASVLLERIKAEKEDLIKEGKIKRSKKSAKTSDTPHYENVPFEVPESWEWCKLGAVNEIARGGSPRPIKDYLTNDVNGINWIKIGDTTKDGKYINSVKERIRPEGVKKSRLVHKGDFLLTNSMSFGRPYILNVDGCIHDGWLVISPIGEAYTSDFLYYLLSSSFAFEQFTNVASGGVVTNLNSDKVADTKFPLPPYAEQGRIVSEIECWFALIDVIECGKTDLQDTIEQAKSKILDLAIHGKLVPQDPNDEPAIELLKRINPDFTPCDNGHSRKFPQSWCSVTVNDVCSIIGGVSYNKADIQDTGIRVLRGGNIQNGKVIDCFDDVFIPLSYQNNDNQVQHGDIIVVASTGSQTLIGKTGFADRDIPKTQIGAFLRIVRPKQKALSPYIRLIFQTDDYKGYIRNVAKGSNINNVKNAHLQNYQIYLPPLEEQQRIVQKIEALFSVLDNIQNALEV